MKKIILTPGPLTTNEFVREAAIEDYPSRDVVLNQMTHNIRENILTLCHGQASHTAILMQGSGTYAVEAAVQSLIPAHSGHALVLSNGVYSRRIYEICLRAGLNTTLYEVPELLPFDPEEIQKILCNDASITDVLLVHCETGSGLVNPLHRIADVVSAAGRRLIVDAMSTFGVLEIDLRELAITALITSSNKCLEGLPGIGVVIASTRHLENCKANARSLSLDLHAQWQRFNTDGEWRFTPPVQIVAALDRALSLLRAEGGIPARRQRYQTNLDEILTRMLALNFETVLPLERLEPIIVAFHCPEGFDFSAFYEQLKASNIYLYPGALTHEKTFRIGCIGAVNRDDIAFVMDRITTVLQGTKKWR